MSKRRFISILISCLLLLGVGCKKSTGGSKPPAPVEPTPHVTAEADKAQAASATGAVEFLRKGDFARAGEAAGALLKNEPTNAYALMVRAISSYKATMHGLVATVGKTLDVRPSAGAFQHAAIRKVYDSTEKSLGRVAADLAAAARSDKVHLELCLACWEVDWNMNGRVDRRDRLLLQVERDAAGKEYPTDSPLRKPVFRFDLGDIYWGRAYVAFQRAALNLVLAYDWSALDALLLRQREMKLHIPLREPARMKQVRALLMEGLRFSGMARLAYLAETDDDREWIPNPRQKSHPFPLTVDVALYETWGGVLKDLQNLLDGKEGLSVSGVTSLFHRKWKDTPAGFIDIGAMLNTPGDIELHLPTIMAWLEFRPRHGMPALEGLLKQIFGRCYVTSMRPSKLTDRIERIKNELAKGDETFERKLRYLLWLN